jgi:hypothetical protein
MDMSPSTAIRLFLQVFPVTVKTALYHLLRLSENVAKQTLRTELLVAIIRTLVAIPTPIGRIQAFGNRDQGIKGGIWISKVTIPAPPGGDLADLVLRAVKDLDESGMGVADTGLPDLKTAAIGAEWTGPRGNVAKDAPRPDFEEREHYESLVKESPGETTILYFHGGGYFTMDVSRAFHLRKPNSSCVMPAELLCINGSDFLTARISSSDYACPCEVDWRSCAQRPLPACAAASVSMCPSRCTAGVSVPDCATTGCFPRISQTPAYRLRRRLGRRWSVNISTTAAIAAPAHGFDERHPKDPA